jgi:hypothetical protein
VVAGGVGGAEQGGQMMMQLALVVVLFLVSVGTPVLALAFPRT